MEGTGFIVSIILNVLLIVSTGILIWDKFKPEKINLKCDFIKDDLRVRVYVLIITNLSSKTLNINRILLDSNDFHSVDSRKYPVTIQPQNEIRYRITISKLNKKPTKCQIEILSKRKPKILDFTI